MGSGPQQGIKPTLAIKGHQIIAAADMAIADENLRHGRSAPRTFDHLGALGSFTANIDFAERLVLFLQKAFGAHAIRHQALV